MDLKAARKSRRLTQEQLEALSGIDQAVISNIERGTVTNPLWATVYRLSKALRYRPEVIFPVADRRVA